jgi:hypothetical protein
VVRSAPVYFTSPGKYLPAHLLLARHIQNVSDRPIQLFSWHTAQADRQPEKVHSRGICTFSD